ncbi:MAG: 2-amino-4-hydroxy-6-hydroxymethyldihydropteridine diphosphokinase [Parachlamydiaceae bacterium]
MLQQAFISLGSNLGTPIDNIRRALDEIAKLEGISGFRYSRFYETEPVSLIQQNFFINAACVFLTKMSPEELLYKLQLIEKKLGKEPKPKDAPRVIDLDLLFVGREWRSSQELVLPHPEWNKRRFVLEPLLDLTEEISFYDEGVLRTLNIRKFLQTFSTTKEVRVIV